MSTSVEISSTNAHLTWRAPTASVGNFILVGCDSTRALLVEICSNFKTEHHAINITFDGGGNDVGVGEWVSRHSTAAKMSRPFIGGEKQHARDATLNVTETMVAVESIAIIAGTGAESLSSWQIS